MKNGIIFVLFVLVVLLLLGAGEHPQPLIEDISLKRAAAADSCAPPPPPALLPHDGWDGAHIRRSKDGGTA